MVWVQSQNLSCVLLPITLIKVPWKMSLTHTYHVTHCFFWEARGKELMSPGSGLRLVSLCSIHTFTYKYPQYTHVHTHSMDGAYTLQCTIQTAYRHHMHTHSRSGKIPRRKAANKHTHTVQPTCTHTLTLPGVWTGHGQTAEGKWRELV